MKSKFLALATIAGALTVMSASAKADYLIRLGWGGTFVFDTCSCEDPLNGGIGGDIQFTTPTGPGTYSGVIPTYAYDVNYSVTVTPDPVPADGAFVTYSATFMTDLGVGETYWEMGGDSLQDGALIMYAADTIVPGVGFGSSGIEAITYAVPEPANIALMLAGLGLIGFMVRRRKARSSAPR